MTANTLEGNQLVFNVEDITMNADVDKEDDDSLFVIIVCTVLLCVFCYGVSFGVIALHCKRKKRKSFDQHVHGNFVMSMSDIDVRKSTNSVHEMPRRTTESYYGDGQEGVEGTGAAMDLEGGSDIQRNNDFNGKMGATTATVPVVHNGNGSASKSDTDIIYDETQPTEDGSVSPK